MKLKVLDLFSGIGGFSLGLERTGGFETVAFCEIDPFCQKVLKKHWPDVPIYPDVRTLNYDGPVDVITGGYPCQPFSEAGKRQGTDDERHLWPEMLNVVKKHRPSWVIGENVTGHISLGLDEVLADLESEAYAARAFVIPACAVDAPHRRDRVWIVANSNRGGGRSNIARGDNLDRQDAGRQEKNGLSRAVCPPGYAGTVANANGEGLSERHVERGHHAEKEPEEKRSKFSGAYAEIGRRWKAEPRVGRVAHGVPSRVDRLKTLGNAVVPQIPEMIGHAILQAEAA